MKLCADCLKGKRLPGTPGGDMLKIGVTDCYYARASDAVRTPAAEKSAILVFTDIFGLPLPNPKIMADGFAMEIGVDVYVPDLFAGHPPIREEDLLPYDHTEIGVKPPLWKNLGYTWQVLKSMPNMMTTGSRPSAAGRMITFVENLKKEKGVEKLGVVGEAHTSWLVGGVIADLMPYHLFSSAVICHPGDFDHKLVDEINFPTSWVTCEEDAFFSPTSTEDVNERLARRNQQLREQGKEAPEYEMKRYMGTRHGFACRPALEVEAVRNAWEGAWEQTVRWFKKTLL
ncbi:hypothetical protein DACRYDRAFT_101010 [Dacryopinax primogenitus]|uniref:Dienelactone hydrolase domain-containing protein n=1 Tax=Dacryopinax primogenitus (strain DJM 731) TaxID=1858805 RepID=M5FRP0_DACPD|nr:uncharacterized protein DACRYDRAFT_101010 [Dacryopinax primogenitus]EJT99860.1 hypothetical protein DACRYDRAFT_101010 [Dacryopinax primogenitus]